MPMTVNEIATNDCLQGCVSAYTGEKITVRVVCTNVGRDAFVFLAPGTRTPAEFHETLEELFDLAGMRNGIKGLAGEEGMYVCPYNGNRMSLQKTSNGFRLVGGFDPTCPVMSAEMFAHLVKMRAGVPDPTAPYPSMEKPKVTVIGVKEPPDPKYARTQVSDEAGEMAEKIAHQVKRAAGKVTVKT